MRNGFTTIFWIFVLQKESACGRDRRQLIKNVGSEGLCHPPTDERREREEGQRRAKHSPQVAKREGGKNFQNFSLSLSPQIVGRLEPSWLVLFLFKSRIFKSLPAWLGAPYGKARRVRSAWKRQTTTLLPSSYILSGTNEFLHFFPPTTLLFPSVGEI